MATIDIQPAGVGLLPALEGAGLIAWHLAATPFIGRERLHWGATPHEAAAPLPGDELVPEPKWTYTYAVDIAAAPEDVWPWIAQIGQGRGGFYSYQTLENVVGCNIHNHAEILPEYQDVALGDPIYLHPTAPPMAVAVLDPPHALVLYGSPADTGDGSAAPAMSTWQFCLQGTPDGFTRFFTRGRSDYGPGMANRVFFGRYPIEPITFVMSRKMMLEVKALAEAA
jgi:hypothetical protein